MKGRDLIEGKKGRDGEMGGKGELYYQHMLKDNPEKFMVRLDENLKAGECKSISYNLQLDVLSREKNASEALLLSYRNDNGDTVAHTAASFHQEPEALMRCIDLAPKLLLAEREDEFDGQTPLHIVISKGNLDMARSILQHPECQENKEKVLKKKATGSLFADTVMMGELPLSVAALTLDTEMVELLIQNGADVKWKNKQKDTVLHSLIRFADVHDDKLEGALEMMTFLNDSLPSSSKAIWHEAKNKDGLTPLTLAVSLGTLEMFTLILNFDGVYRSLNTHDGLFDTHLYDITEIDTITQAEWERYGTDKDGEEEDGKSEACCSWSRKEKKSWKDSQHKPALSHKAPAVLDIICQLPVRQAFDFINVEAVKELINRKWNHYKWFFKLWAVYHIALLVHITTYAVYKTKVVNSNIYSNYGIKSVESDFVYISVGFVFLYAIVYLIHEFIRSLYFKQGWHLNLIQHNGWYRLMMVAFSIALIVDSVWFLMHPDNNYFLIIALIIGWTFMTFFLRTWKRFSFYTVMFQKVLLGDMTRLSVIILFQLIAFSIAIYTTFLNTKPIPEGFDNAGMAILTMFKLMLGLTDIEVLHEARQPGLAIALYVTFVLVTYVLLINSLIAMMSRTCDLISEDRHRQWELQRLSVILLLETMLFPGWRYLHKAGVKAIRRYGVKGQEFRCYIEITSIQRAYRDGMAVLRRKAMINTIGFGDGVGGTSRWSSMFASMGRTSYNRGPNFSSFRRTAVRDTIAEESDDGDDDNDSLYGIGPMDSDDDNDENNLNKFVSRNGRSKIVTGIHNTQSNNGRYSHNLSQPVVPHSSDFEAVRLIQGRRNNSNRPRHTSAAKRRFNKVLAMNAFLREKLRKLKRSPSQNMNRQSNEQVLGSELRRGSFQSENSNNSGQYVPPYGYSHRNSRQRDAEQFQPSAPRAENDRSSLSGLDRSDFRPQYKRVGKNQREIIHSNIRQGQEDHQKQASPQIPGPVEIDDPASESEHRSSISSSRGDQQSLIYDAQDKMANNGITRRQMISVESAKTKVNFTSASRPREEPMLSSVLRSQDDPMRQLVGTGDDRDSSERKEKKESQRVIASQPQVPKIQDIDIAYMHSKA